MLIAYKNCTALLVDDDTGNESDDGSSGGQPHGIDGNVCLTVVPPHAQPEKKST